MDTLVSVGPPRNILLVQAFATINIGSRDRNLVMEG